MGLPFWGGEWGYGKAGPPPGWLLTRHGLVLQGPLAGANRVATNALLVLVSLGPIPRAGSPVPTSPAGAQAATWGTSLTSDPGSNRPALLTESPKQVLDSVQPTSQEALVCE